MHVTEWIGQTRAINYYSVIDSSGLDEVTEWDFSFKGKSELQLFCGCRAVKDSWWVSDGLDGETENLRDSREDRFRVEVQRNITGVDQSTQGE